MNVLIYLFSFFIYLAIVLFHLLGLMGDPKIHWVGGSGGGGDAVFLCVESNNLK